MRLTVQKLSIYCILLDKNKGKKGFSSPAENYDLWLATLSVEISFIYYPQRPFLTGVATRSFQGQLQQLLSSLC